jgi:hypothetical protein
MRRIRGLARTARKRRLPGKPPGFRTIDNFTGGVATSIKSIDLNAATYQIPGQLAYRLNQYVDKVSSYNGGSFANKVVLDSEIAERVLSLAVPKGSITEEQRAVIEAVRSRARALGRPVEISITEF